MAKDDNAPDEKEYSESYVMANLEINGWTFDTHTWMNDNLFSDEESDVSKWDERVLKVMWKRLEQQPGIAALQRGNVDIRKNPELIAIADAMTRSWFENIIYNNGKKDSQGNRIFPTLGALDAHITRAQAAASDEPTKALDAFLSSDGYGGNARSLYISGSVEKLNFESMEASTTKVIDDIFAAPDSWIVGQPLGADLDLDTSIVTGVVPPADRDAIELLAEVEEDEGTPGTALTPFTQAIGILFDERKAVDFWINGLPGMNAQARMTTNELKPKIIAKWRSDTSLPGSAFWGKRLLTYLNEKMTDEVDISTGDINYVDTDRSSAEIVAMAIEENYGLPFPPSSGFTKQRDAIAKEHTQAVNDSMTKVNVAEESKSLVLAEMGQLGYLDADGNPLDREDIVGEYDEDSGEYPKDRYDSYMARIAGYDSAIATAESLPAMVFDKWFRKDAEGRIIGLFKTEEELAAGKAWDDEQALLNTPGKRKGLVESTLRRVGALTKENGRLDSNGLITAEGQAWLDAVTGIFNDQWDGRDTSPMPDGTPRPWSDLLASVLGSDLVPNKLAGDAAKVAQKAAEDAQKATDEEYARFARLDPRGMVNEIATNMGLLTADTDPITLAKFFGASEASMSVMNQVRDRKATAPAGTDFKELVKEIIENIDSPQMRTDAPPGVPGTSASNQALYSDYQKLLNDYNTSTLLEDVKGPRFQEALATLIKDNNLRVDIPTDGSPINQADVVLAITGQPMDITGIIGASPAAAAAAADADAIARKAAAPQVMQESQANLDVLATKYGINLDEYTKGTNAEIDAAFAALDKASSESQYVTPIPQQPSAPVQPPQAVGYIAPDPASVSYGGEAPLTKEQWKEQFFPGKTEGVDFFIPEGQDIYVAPTAGEVAETDAAREAEGINTEGIESERLKAAQIAKDEEDERKRLADAAPRGLSGMVK